MAKPVESITMEELSARLAKHAADKVIHLKMANNVADWHEFAELPIDVRINHAIKYGENWVWEVTMLKQRDTRISGMKP